MTPFKHWYFINFRCDICHQPTAVCGGTLLHTDRQIRAAVRWYKKQAQYHRNKKRTLTAANLEQHVTRLINHLKIKNKIRNTPPITNTIQFDTL